jgi:hypothetical protein
MAKLFLRPGQRFSICRLLNCASLIRLSSWAVIARPA